MTEQANEIDQAIRRVASLIEENAAVIAEFAADKERAVLLTALCMRLGHLPSGVERLRAPQVQEVAQ